MKTVKAKNYATRSELEEELEKTTELKSTIIISGTLKELEHLKLSDTSKIWGISCVATDKVIKNISVHSKPERGEIFKSNLK